MARRPYTPITHSYFQSDDPKDPATAAEALAGLSQSSFQSAIAGQLPMQHTFQASILPASHQQTGPSSHPHGPPNLGQPLQTSSMRTEVPEGDQTQPLDEDSQLLGASVDTANSSQDDGEPGDHKPGSGRRSGRNATMTNEEWTRQRKDNHVRATII